MSKRIFDLQGVPSDEAQDVRHLLRRSKIRFYETSEGDYLGGAALWVDRETDFIEARALIDDYQRQLKERSQKKKPRYKNKSVFEIIGQKIRRDVPFLLFAILVVLILIYMLVLGVGRR